MPLATLHLLALSNTTSISAYLKALSADGIVPIVVSKPIKWIIKPETLSVSHLLNPTWDLFLIVAATQSLPSAYLTSQWVSSHWSITAGVPSSLLNGFHEKNRNLLHPKSNDDVPALTGSMENPRVANSSQGLELDHDLLSWSKTHPLGRGRAVSMLNLLAFYPTASAHTSYKKYGAEFATSIGSRRGGNAKIVGKVVPQQQQTSEGEDRVGWDEIAFVHYPSLDHFVDMLASEDYQKVNHEFRLPALRDTCILCTSELDEEVVVDRAKL